MKENSFVLRFLVYLTFFTAITSCVSNKNATYLRNGNELKEDVPRDSVVRSYDLHTASEYRIRRDDQLNIRVSTTTPAEYNSFMQADPASAINSRQMQSTIIGGERGTIYGYEVDTEGYIAVPMLGRVLAKGRTISELEKEIQVGLSKYLKDPIVYINLLNFRFSVLGEVRREGMHSTFNHRITMVEAMSLAGGFGELAERSRVKLIRDNEGVAEVVYLDFLSEDFVSSPYYFVQPNDVLIVQPNKQRPAVNYAYRNASLVASIVGLIVSVATLVTRN
ncbi:polysaccharide biosynthesis/export family protein [Algivirga pacifica]|uniref:Polysaccharide biosynthesis/export family protein n=1 Tax=Algivirga pacifica TaxID=1162670 RepID=A0ABP9DA96_9BACT